MRDNPAWSGDERKAYVRQLENGLVVKLGVNTNSTHEAILAKCAERGIVFTQKEPKAAMLWKLRTVVQDQIVVTFGEHAGKTFH